MNVTLRGSAKVIYTAELQVYNYCSALGQLMTECEEKNQYINSMWNWPRGPKDLRKQEIVLSRRLLSNKY